MSGQIKQVSDLHFVEFILFCCGLALWGWGALSGGSTVLEICIWIKLSCLGNSFTGIISGIVEYTNFAA
jgi:hypothetical protein